MDPFSNFEALRGQSLGFIHKADSYEDETGQECEGSCSGIILTESWEALSAGHTDVRWWDTLLRHSPPSGCLKKKHVALEAVRSAIMPFGVGRSAGGGTGYRNPNFPQKPNGWKMPGYPAESLSDGDLETMKQRILEALTCE